MTVHDSCQVRSIHFRSLDNTTHRTTISTALLPVTEEQIPKEWNVLYRMEHMEQNVAYRWNTWIMKYKQI